MTKQELQGYRQQLQALATRLAAQVRNMRDETFRTGGDGASVDFSTDQADWESHETEEDRTLRVLETEQELLRDVESAQARIRSGTFGHCEECGLGIAKARLDAVPYARHCIACASKLVVTQPPL